MVLAGAAVGGIGVLASALAGHGELDANAADAADGRVGVCDPEVHDATALVTHGDLDDPFIRLGVSLGLSGPQEALGLEPLSRQADRLTRPDRYPIAAINGDDQCSVFYSLRNL